MNNRILSIDDHLDVIPDEYDIEDSTTYMGIIWGWAFERRSLSDEFYTNELYTKAYSSLIEKRITIEKFVVNYLNGEIKENYFLKDMQEFIDDYISAGVFYKQICAFYQVKDVYALPKDWNVCRAFFNEIEKHYLDVKCNY